MMGGGKSSEKVTTVIQCHIIKIFLPATCYIVREIYRVIKNDCRGFNNLSYTIHLR